MDGRDWMGRIPLWARITFGAVLGTGLVLGFWLSWGIWVQGLMMFGGMALVFAMICLPGFLLGVVLQLAAGRRLVPGFVKWIVGALGTVLLWYLVDGLATVRDSLQTLSGVIDALARYVFATVLFVALVDGGVQFVNRYRQRHGNHPPGVPVETDYAARQPEA